MKMIFATNNQNKAYEIAALIPPHFQVLTLKESGINIDIEEPWNTLEENAKEKAQTIYSQTHIASFGEDTGLEVLALHGEPGVKSARYAGNDRSDDANIKKLLANLDASKSRLAQFRTVVCLVKDAETFYFEGICKGTIAKQPVGEKGFGYDAVFIPDGANKTFAQMEREEKNLYSHRQKAISKLVAFLNQL